MKEEKELLKALADFQQDCPVIHKATKGYNYTYTDLPAIYKVINPLLKKHGLGFTQLMNKEVLTTVLYHIESGQNIHSETEIIKGVSLKGQNEFQTLGSQITYLRRYSLSCMLGIITDKDLDACGIPEETKKDDPTLKTKFDALLKTKIDAITKCDTIEKLQNIWSSNKEFHKEQSFIIAKDLKKVELTKKSE